MADLPNRITELRREARLTQEQLGERIGCGKMHVSGMERGTRELTVGWMRRISKALTEVLNRRVTVADLLVDDDNPDRVPEPDRPIFDALRYGDEATRAVMRRVAESAPGYRAEPQKLKAR